LLKETLRRNVNRPDEELQGPSPVWDALFEAIGVVRDQDGRRGVVLIGDGRATGNRRRFAEVVERAVLDDVAISTIAQSARSGNEFHPDVHPDRYLKALAAATGGSVVEDEPRMDRPGKTRQLLENVIRELHNSYAVTFTADVPLVSAPRRLEVLARRTGIVVRAKTSLPR
jgi:hypothetical protein